MMTGMDEARCLTCGLVIDEDENGWICRGCNHRCDQRGRKLRKQPSSAERIRKRFEQPNLFETPPDAGGTYAPKWIPNEEEPPLTRSDARRPRRVRPKCVPCDRWYVVKSGRLVCFACGAIHEPKVA